MLTAASKISDLVLIASGAVIAHALTASNMPHTSSGMLFILLDVVLALLILRIFRVYRQRFPRTGTAAIVPTLAAWLATQSLMFLLVCAFPDGHGMGVEWLVASTVITGILLVFGKYVLSIAQRWLGAHGYGQVPVAIAAFCADSHGLVEQIVARKNPGIFIPELILDAGTTRDTVVEGLPVVHEIETFAQLVRGHRIEEVWIVGPSANQGAVGQLVSAFRHDFVNIRVVSDIGGENLPEPAIVDYMGLRVLNLVASPERGLALLPKAVFDRVFALLALLALAPLMAIIALVVKSTSPGPAIFRQYRKGVDGRVFTIYKFRTMRRDADRPGTVVQARVNDPRVTRTGRLLRRTSLDELPQFFNVLKGDMSVVGPRPHAIEHDDYYKDLVQNYMYRYRVKPGITGLAQISGFRGETSQTEKMTGRVRLDIHYIRHRTFWLDLKIVALTVIRGMTGSGAY
ncbi:undecaprenyl-phosphate glucose phosphotransferase [Paraburkholderia sartisoli]|uniref:Putative colanic acid biosysnthesis UDP-glucose lipid carrier transferase n=1 Tax=Paraburkholderia sartisoli TaxID=83784 RepID=A0A1H4HT21_9BURK|nr:undecaprenyl-phosphate glucose phosphotransferase [Paraburkholderia sartisoli]SEB24905.1 putative colanic acid biosysnthesis UDP-glucose lipid carrier transferase [Paraburkholderia sartisoli]